MATKWSRTCLKTGAMKLKTTKTTVSCIFEFIFKAFALRIGDFSLAFSNLKYDSAHYVILSSYL